MQGLKRFIIYVYSFGIKAFKPKWLNIFFKPRYTKGSINVKGMSFAYSDSNSFISTYAEIFLGQIYNFTASNAQPLIIDCGSNIGLSILFFKQKYPNSKVIGFEPDKNIFNLLSSNVTSNKLKKVELINKGVWNKNSVLQFSAEGADGGRLSDLSVIENAPDTAVEVCRLRDYLTTPVEFLKIDIEGAELEVLLDCKDLLINVKNLFVEYHSFGRKTQSLEIILTTLKDAGFRYYIDNSGVRSKQPFVKIKYSMNMDLQLNIFAHRHESDTH